jgi:hypothetical protein
MLLWMLSHTLGGLNMTWGPISFRSCMAVSTASGKLTAKPPVRAMATDIICSPIQARGRKER